MRRSRVLVALVAGALFGSGLALSGMSNPDKVLNFLDLAGHWDPSLALVMGGALLVTLPGFAWLRRSGGLPGCPVPSPSNNRRIDARLVSGSILFGIGWGIAGYCPGPALANLALGGEAVAFVLALVAGSQLARLLPDRPR